MRSLASAKPLAQAILVPAMNSQNKPPSPAGNTIDSQVAVITHSVSSLSVNEQLQEHERRRSEVSAHTEYLLQSSAHCMWVEFVDASLALRRNYSIPDGGLLNAITGIPIGVLQNVRTVAIKDSREGTRL